MQHHLMIYIIFILTYSYKFFKFYNESLPKQHSNPKTSTYSAFALLTKLANDKISLAESLCTGSSEHQAYRSSSGIFQFKNSNHTCSQLSVFFYFQLHSVLRFSQLPSSGLTMKVNHESVVTSGDKHTIHLWF